MKRTADTQQHTLPPTHPAPSYFPSSPAFFTVLSRAAHIDSDVTAAIKQQQMAAVWLPGETVKKVRGGGSESYRTFNLERRQTERVIFQPTSITDVKREIKNEG